jgi:hypothetical protein
MEGSRWLLPFTHGVDMQAIDAAVRLAEGASATLVAVSLISVPAKSPARGARLEHIQQSKDFLESVYYWTSEQKIPLERHEIFTPMVEERLTTLCSELSCDAIILSGRNRRAALLHPHQVKQLMAEPPVRLLYIHLEPLPEKLPVRSLGTRVLAWLRGFQGSECSMEIEPGAAWEGAAKNEPVALREGGDIHVRSTNLTGGRR